MNDSKKNQDLVFELNGGMPRMAQASDALGGSPAWVATIFAKTPVVVAALVAILLNLVLPKDKK